MKTLLHHSLLPLLWQGLSGIRLTVVALILAVLVQSLPHQAVAATAEPAAMTHTMDHAHGHGVQLAESTSKQQPSGDHADHTGANCGGAICCAGINLGTAAIVAERRVVFMSRSYSTATVALPHMGTTLKRPPRFLI